MHHHILKKFDDQKYFHGQSFDSFCQQIKWIKNQANQQKIKELYEDQNGCFVTLDDGLKSHLTPAQLLFRSKMKGKFYYCTSVVYEKVVLNVHLTHILLKLLNLRKKKLLMIELKKKLPFNHPGYDTDFVYRNQKSSDLDWEIKTLVNYKCPQEPVRDILLYFLKSFGGVIEKELHASIYMNLKDLKEIKKMGHEILPHFHSHCLLSSLENSELASEFQSMHDIHLELFDEKYMEVCVPFGSNGCWDKRCEDLAISYGIKNIILVDPIEFIMNEKSSNLNYVSRTDCCLLPHFEYR